MKILLIFFLLLSSCEHYPRPNRTYYFVDWVNMPSEFNFPRVNYLRISKNEVEYYKQKQKTGESGEVRGPYVFDWRGNLVSEPEKQEFIEPPLKNRWKFGP